MALEDLDGKQLYLPEMATIKAAKQLTEMERWFEVELSGGRDLGHKPMQFVEVSVFGIGEAPFSISSSPTKKGRFEMCIRNVGNLSHYMAGLDPKARIGIRGPMGNGLDPKEFEGKDVLIFAGGLGMVPVRSLINYILDNRKDFGRFTILYGCKTPQEILYKDDLANWEANPDVDVYLTVDKPDKSWEGNSGVITRLLPRIEIDPHNTKVMMVGPPIMFKFVILELYKRSISSKDIYMSLERRMKCGVGRCGHCQINHLLTCQDGPVFRFDQLRNLSEAI